MFLDKNDMEMIINGINNYQFIKEELTEKIKKGYSLEQLENYIRKLKGTEITGTSDYEDIKYLDFIYDNVNMYIQEELDNGIKVSERFEIYNTKEHCYIVEDFLTLKEYEDMLNESKEEKIKSALIDLDFFKKYNFKEQHDILLEKVINFIKEEC